MYKLYTDKQETFECDLFLEGADLKNSSARIIVESNDLTLMFKGKIDKKGNVIENILLILDYETIIQDQPLSGHLRIISPALVNNSNFIDFHTVLFIST